MGKSKIRAAWMSAVSFSASDLIVVWIQKNRTTRSVRISRWMTTAGSLAARYVFSAVSCVSSESSSCTTIPALTPMGASTSQSRGWSCWKSCVRAVSIALLTAARPSLTRPCWMPTLFCTERIFYLGGLGGLGRVGNDREHGFDLLDDFRRRGGLLRGSKGRVPNFGLLIELRKLRGHTRDAVR